jgi:hypothetical protein
MQGETPAARPGRFSATSSKRGKPLVLACVRAHRHGSLIDRLTTTLDRQVFYWIYPLLDSGEPSESALFD